ncbi:hypothetical protein GQR58_015720 [Nymphon striatum]|nr:hypothetical protein GQR58_015720 [Nymphon striatum]
MLGRSTNDTNQASGKVHRPQNSKANDSSNTPRSLKQINIDTIWKKPSGEISLKDKTNTTVISKMETEKINQRQAKANNETINVKKRKPLDGLSSHNKRQKTLHVFDISSGSSDTTKRNHTSFLGTSCNNHSNVETVDITDISIFVLCPVCDKKIQENKINNHLDFCLNSS